MVIHVWAVWRLGGHHQVRCPCANGQHLGTQRALGQPPAPQKCTGERMKSGWMDDWWWMACTKTIKNPEAPSKFPCCPMAFLRSVWMLRLLRSMLAPLSMICAIITYYYYICDTFLIYLSDMLYMWYMWYMWWNFGHALVFVSSKHVTARFNCVHTAGVSLDRNHWATGAPSYAVEHCFCIYIYI